MRGANETGARLPFCSVIVATRDRPGQLGECLAALSRLDYPRERFEVIVVDDGSEVWLAPVVAQSRNGLDVSLLTRPRMGAPRAWNIAADSARGEFLAFLDDDCIPDPGWLRALAQAARRSQAAGVGGLTLNARPDERYAAAAHLIVEVGYAWNNRDAGRAVFLASNNLMLPADWFHALGGFDERFARSADRDLLDRWRAAGLPLVYEHHAVVAHAQRLDFGGFVRKHYANGEGVLRYHRARRAREGSMIRPEPGYYAELLRRSLAQGGLRGAALVTLALAANYAGYAAALTSGRLSVRWPDGAATAAGGREERQGARPRARTTR